MPIHMNLPPEVHRDMEEANKIIHQLERSQEAREYSVNMPSEELRDVRAGLSIALRLLSFISAQSALGECRKETPYSQLRPVIDSDGTFKWCCNHKTEHCSA